MASSYGEDASKSALRSGYLAVLGSLTPSHKEIIDRDVRMHFHGMAAYRKAAMILAYVTYRDEMDTSSIIERAWKDGKRVALPVCQKGRLVFYEVNSLEGLSMGSRGVLEPDPDACEQVDYADLKNSVCLVPGLCFDSEGYRIGYGAGYYDDFLAGYPGLKVGLARSIHVSGNPLPRDEHDIPVDVLVSDGAVWMCKR